MAASMIGGGGFPARRDVPASDPAIDYDEVQARVVAGLIERNVATVEDLPEPGTGEGATLVIRTVQRVGDFPQTTSISPLGYTEGDINVELSCALVDDQGKAILLAGNEPATFTLKEKGSNGIPVINALPATLSAPDGDDLRTASFAFTQAHPVPAGGEYEGVFVVGGQTYPRGRRIPVRIIDKL